jgi:toxin ParE1/3/4
MIRLVPFVSEQAELDVAHAAERYNAIQPGLGDDLVRRVKQALARIAEYPEAYAVVQPSVRRALLRRFPYGVFYRIRHDRIEVEAVFHLHADPGRVGERFDSLPQ